jgi:hypothetical protein
LFAGFAAVSALGRGERFRVGRIGEGFVERLVNRKRPPRGNRVGKRLVFEPSTHRRQIWPKLESFERPAGGAAGARLERAKQPCCSLLMVIARFERCQAQKHAPQ